MTGTQTDSSTGSVEFQGKCYMSLENLLSQVQVDSFSHHYDPAIELRKQLEDYFTLYPVRVSSREIN